MRKLLSVLGTLTMLFAAACTQEDVDKFLNDVMEVPATSIRFTEPSYMMTVGETLTLTVVVEPSNTTAAGLSLIRLLRTKADSLSVRTK